VSNLIYTAPRFFAGELVLWKGYWFRVVAYTPNGGEIHLKDSLDGQEIRGMTTTAMLVLELYKPSDGHEKRARATGRRAERIARNKRKPLQ
jgi:hypothetical protein